MKKVALWIGGVILGLLVLVMLVLFTPPGNAIVKPIIQSQIDKYAPLKLDLETFSLGFTSVDILIKHQDAIEISLKGDLSIFTQNIDVLLKVDAKDISPLGELADTELQGSFVIDTTAKGSFSDMLIHLTSDIAKSSTDINLTLKDYSPKSIVGYIKDLQISEVMTMAGIKPYASGNLQFEANVNGDEDMNFNGNTLLNITQGSVNSTLIKKDFAVQVPKTTFVIALNAIFDMDKLNHDLSFNSNIGNIHSNGDTSLNTLTTQSSYNINLSDLSSFTPLVGMPIRGSFATKGDISGGQEELSIKGSSDVASSKTTYSVILKNLSPYTVVASVKDLRLDTVLWMIHKPRYATMKLNAESEIADFDKNISTNTTIKLSGVTSNAIIKQEFDMDMPATNFTLDSSIALKQGVGEADSALKSDIANLTLDNTQINIKDFAITAPYQAVIPNLKKLKFATGVELAGEIKAQGQAKITDKIYADFNTTSLGGSVDAKLDDNHLTANIKDVNTTKFFEIAQIKPVFSSSINGDLQYDTNTQKGTLNAILSNGKLLTNQVTELAAKYLKTDITKEAYEDAKLNADIEGKKITSDISLKSTNTTITAQGASIDLEKDNINADLKFQIKDKAITLKARNKLSSPSFSVDAGDLIKAEATKAVEKQLDKAIDKYLGDDAKEGAKNLLKKLF